MPTTIVNLHVTTLARDEILVAVRTDAGRLTTTIAASKVPDWPSAANWLLAQAGSLVPWTDDATRRKKVTLTWHTDADGGRVLDSYLVEDMEETTALAALLASPLATVTVAQADAQVDAITNLADAKAYLKRVDALVITMRDVLVKTLGRLRDDGLV
jgi:hypothetical protein